MLQESFKQLRKEKGYTQHELGLKLNVTRQTISKWEKGLSVPDADMLLKISLLFEISVGELLGANIQEDINKDNVTVLLSRINEQIAVKNRRNHFIIKAILLVFGFFIVLNIILIITNVISFNQNTNDLYNQNQETIEGITPFDLSKEAEDLLNLVGYANNAKNMYIEPPDEAVGMILKTHLLQDDNTFSSEEITATYWDMINEKYIATLTTILNKDGSVEIKGGGFSASVESVLDEDYKTHLVAWDFLNQHTEIKLNEEIPIMIRLYDDGNSYPVLYPGAYFEPERFDGFDMDVVHVITITFTDVSLDK